MTMPPSKVILTKLLRGSLYLVFIGVCVEVGLQAFYYFTAGDFLFRRVGIPIYAREPYSGFGNRPGLYFDHRTNEFRARYYINGAGFRVSHPQVEYSLAKPSNVYRIMLLGPSFAFGWGVDYELSFASVLQQLLQKSGFADAKKIEIINAGVPAILPAQQLTWFEHVGKDYAPDLVIQIVYASMANKDVTEPISAVNDDGYLVPLHTTMVLRWRDRLKKFAIIFYGWTLWTSLNSGSPVASGGQSGAVLGAGREIPTPISFEPTHPEVREAMQFYKKLARIVGKAGARLLVVYVPLSYAVQREDQSRWRLLGIRDIPRQMAFDAAFVRSLNDHQVPSIDLTRKLRKAARGGERMYYWLDVHWTPAGNTAAARAVAHYLIGSRITTSRVNYGK